MTPRPPHPSRWLRLPHGTIRLRLTLLYGALFLVSAAALLTVTYLLVEHQYTQNGASLFIITNHASGSGQVSVRQRVGTIASGPGYLAPGLPTPTQVTADAHARSSAALNQLLINSGIALGIMALISVWLGWLVAGPSSTSAANDREHSPRDLGDQPSPAARARRARRRDHTAREHVRRPARPARGILRSAASVRGQRLPRTPHAADPRAGPRRGRARRSAASVASPREMGERVISNGEYLNG